MLAVGLVLLIIIGAAFNALTNFHQQVTTGSYVTQIQVGSGFDQATDTVKGESGTFHIGGMIFLVFTVQGLDAGILPEVKLFGGNALSQTDLLHDAPSLPPFTANVYAENVYVTATAIYRLEVDINGIPEASITFQVTG